MGISDKTDQTNSGSNYTSTIILDISITCYYNSH